MFRHYNKIDVLKLRLLEEPDEKTFVAPYVLGKSDLIERTLSDKLCIL
jgi:hypothetical protein